MEDDWLIKEDTHKDETYYSMPWNMHWQMPGYAAQLSQQGLNRKGTVQGAGLQRIYIRSCAYDHNRGSSSGSAYWKIQNYTGCTEEDLVWKSDHGKEVRP